MESVRDLFAPLPARYDLLAEILSFRQNARWRNLMVSRVPATVDGLILDVAAGTAGVTLALARRAPAARVTGIDLTPQMLAEGARRVAAEGATLAWASGGGAQSPSASGHGDGSRVALACGTAERLPFGSATFDALTFTYLLRYVPDPAATLAELARVVKPGGVIASLEFCVPSGPLWWPSWWAYTRLVLPTAGMLTGGPAWWRVGRFLGPNISAHYRKYPVDWTVSAWQKAGMTDVRTRIMSLGGGLVMWGTRASG
jgi:demethylmenaquinone methyltransferase/2-methoxy-6-polyprenyl-1,4-benzoquinol methylase